MSRQAPGLAPGAASAMNRTGGDGTRPRLVSDGRPKSLVTALAGQLQLQVVEIPLDERLADDPSNPPERSEPEQVAELRDSIEQFGLLQPLVVTQAAVFRASNPGVELDTQAEWVLRIGHRRRVAARLAGYKTLPAIVRVDDADVVARLSVALQENYHRADFTPLQEARSLATIRDALGLSQRELSQKTGVSQGQVSKRLQLLDLAPAVQDAIERQEVRVIDALQHLRALSPEKQSEAVKIALAEDRPIDAVARQLERPDPTPGTDSEQTLPAAPTIRDSSETVQPTDQQRVSEPDAAPPKARANQDEPAISSSVAEPRTAAEADAPRDDIDEQATAAQARVAACKHLVMSNLKQADVLGVLVEAALLPPKARPSQAIKVAIDWLGEELGDASPDEFAATIATAGGKAAQRLAIATALARREADLAALVARKGDWDQASRLHVERLVSSGAHTLTEYEARRLRDPSS